MTAQPQDFFRTLGGPLRLALMIALPEATAVVFELQGEGGGTWTLARVGDELQVSSADHRSPDCRLICTAKDFSALLAGELEAQRAFLVGRVAVEGDVGIALALRDAVAGQEQRAS